MLESREETPHHLIGVSALQAQLSVLVGRVVLCCARWEQGISTSLASSHFTTTREVVSIRVLLCYAVLGRAVPCHAMPCCVVPCCAVLCRGAPCCEPLV